MKMQVPNSWHARKLQTPDIYFINWGESSREYSKKHVKVHELYGNLYAEKSFISIIKHL